MSPMKVQDTVQATKGPATHEMSNGLRPSPLKINKDSYSIHKPLNSGSILAAKSQAAKRQPVIIHMHSPKIIHAEARDFMSVVQKLTGFSPPKLKRMEQDSFWDEKDDATSSMLTDDKFNHDSVWHDDDTYFHGVGTLSSNELFPCSSRANHLFQTQTLGGSVSPLTFMDLMKGC